MKIKQLDVLFISSFFFLLIDQDKQHKNAKKANSCNRMAANYVINFIMLEEKWATFPVEKYNQCLPLVALNKRNILT